LKKTHFTVSPFWDKRYTKKGTQLSPISLAITIGYLQFRVGLKMYASNVDFDKITQGRAGNEQIKTLRRDLNEYISKAEGILMRLTNPTRESFQRLFKSETDLFTSNKTDIEYFFKEKIIALNKEERFSSASLYKLALISFKKYRNKLYFENIDETFLKGYKIWMQKEGRSVATAQLYLRNLKAIFRQAIKDGFISERFYPFRNFSIGTTAKSKNVLYPQQIRMLWQYEPINNEEKRAKNYFFFCYLANGMNFKDAVYLKPQVVKSESLYFIREKTKNTNAVANKKINIYLHIELIEIMQQLKNCADENHEYLFPILNGCKTLIEKHNTQNEERRIINKKLNQIGLKLGFDFKLTLNLARHSFATRLKLDGTPLSFISDALGHSTTKTTEHYMKSIPDENIKRISDSLLNFTNYPALNNVSEGK